MKTYVTSDLHFSHKNILNFYPKTRSFKDKDHMDIELTRMWNDLVNPEDTVYILGDVAFTNAEKASAIIKSLNGKKVLVSGNHDVKLIKSSEFVSCFDSVHSYLRIEYKNHIIILFHYPIAEYDMMQRGAIHLHGHLHGNFSGLEEFRVRDVSYDATGKVVSLLDDVIEDALKGKIKPHHIQVN